MQCQASQGRAHLKAPAPHAGDGFTYGKSQFHLPGTGSSTDPGTEKILSSSSPSLDSSSSSCLLHFNWRSHQYTGRHKTPSVDAVFGSVPLNFACLLYSQD